jgi:hypothetical protein
MKMFIIIIVVFCAGMTGCSDNMQSNPFVEGGLYAIRESENGYNIIKILRIDKNGYHVRIYSNVFEEIPKNIDSDTLYLASMNDKKDNEDIGMGHVPVSKSGFEKWQLTFLKKEEVLEDELEGYRMWKEASGGYF